jgi:hypothetical protein
MLAGMMEIAFVTKIVVTVLLVLVLSVVAEHVSPRAAGLLAGYPLGAGIALFFMGLDLGPRFAAASAVYTLLGLVATQAFVFFYFKATLYFKRFPIAAASVLAIAGYFAVIGLLRQIELNKFLAVLIPISSVFLFVYLFREIPNATIPNKVKLTVGVLLLRALLAAVIILLVTGAAKFVGAAWAGLFAAFPITLYPLVLIVHLSYDRQHVHTIIKNFPLGLGSLITYALTVAVVYPVSGVYLGTLISLAAATGYMLLYRLIAVRIRR